MNTPRRSVRIDPELWKAALEVSTERQETVSEVIRRALETYTRPVPTLRGPIVEIRRP